MSSYQILVLSCVFLEIASSVPTEDWKFPPGFKFGAASAAYQVEGAWNISDKGESIWDRFVHTNPKATVDGSNGDVACDSYHNWERDIEIAKELGLHFYRFSISWPRLLPQGFANYISEDGKQYYNNLIDGLLAEGIEPLVTLYHWDLPQVFQDLGGWTNPLIADWFGDYARIAYSLYGDRVKTWLTINEPLAVCDLAYNTGSMAPGILNPDHGTYLCNKNILLAHAKGYRIYDEEFRAKYNGRVSLANQLIWFEPWTEDDTELAELAIENCAGRYSHPIFSKEGGWPPSIEKVLAENSKKKGYTKSVLPAFTEEEIEFVKAARVPNWLPHVVKTTMAGSVLLFRTYDFYAMNHYTSRIVRSAKEGEEIEYWPFGGAPDLNAVLGVRSDWETTTSYWLYMYPAGIRRQLQWLKKRYGDIEYIITENGYSSSEAYLFDMDRINYYENYLKQLLLAIKEDGVRLTQYTAWTMLDNFEWSDGYSSKFGLYAVNFTDPMRTRTPRASAYYYSSIIKNHSLDVKKPIVEEFED